MVPTLYVRTSRHGARALEHSRLSYLLSLEVRPTEDYINPVAAASHPARTSTPTTTHPTTAMTKLSLPHRDHHSAGGRLLQQRKQRLQRCAVPASRQPSVQRRAGRADTVRHHRLPVLLAEDHPGALRGHRQGPLSGEGSRYLTPGNRLGISYADWRIYDTQDAFTTSSPSALSAPEGMGAAGTGATTALRRIIGFRALISGAVVVVFRWMYVRAHNFNHLFVHAIVMVFVFGVGSPPQHGLLLGLAL